MITKTIGAVSAIAVFGVLSLLVAAYGFNAGPLWFYSRTGHLFPIEHVETLRNPLRVVGCEGNALLLGNGSKASIFGVTSLR
ncbi:hypothetical protein JYT83_00355, partial [bacterium AH-315-F18]|nr:hypothetical protein [bacterium AH-315-F18]